MKTSLLALLLASLSVAPSAASPAAIRWTPADAKWTPAPRGAGGAEIWVLEGDPTQAGTFTIRMRVPKGFFLGRHSHPRPERVTVLEGAVQLGVAPDFEAKPTHLGAGSFYVNPPGLLHVVASDVGATLQLTTEGPWEIQRSATGR